MMRRMVAVKKPAPTANPHVGPYTWDDFVALPEGDRRELFDGHLIEVDVPTSFHEAIVMILGYYLHGWARLNGGRVYASGYKVKVSARRGLMPDVRFYRGGRRIPLQALTEGAPDLGIEIVSPSSGRHDRVTKLEYYRSIGMPEYWLIDPLEQSLHRFVLGDGGYFVEAFDGDRVVTPDTFPGLEIPLAELWASGSEDAPAVDGDPKDVPSKS